MDAASSDVDTRLRRTSSEIERDYPNWLDGTTTDSGKHSTQVEGTRKTYNKLGDWIERKLGKGVSVLDASSGMGYGTADLRKRGFNIEDVEPYQSEERKANNPATYDSYDKIGKKYDFIISNAVLNVIPDDWRAGVLHNMATAMKTGGKMFINTRKVGEEKYIKDKIELDSPHEILVKRNGRIASYQRFFTTSELKEWVESELGEGYKVEIANEQNSGTKGLPAVVVTKNNESSTNREASELRQPIAVADAPSANFDAKLGNNHQYAKNIEKMIGELTINNIFGPHEILFKLAKALGYSSENFESHSYSVLDGNVSFRIADHYGTAKNFESKEHSTNNYGFVIKLKLPGKKQPRFKPDRNVDYLEYVFFPENVANYERQMAIAIGMHDYLLTGDIGKLAKPDMYHGSGKYEEEAKRLNAELKRERMANENRMPAADAFNRRSVDATRGGGDRAAVMERAAAQIARR